MTQPQSPLEGSDAVERPVQHPARAARLRMTVTYTVMAVCAALFLLSQAVPGLDYRFGLKPLIVGAEPWTIITSAFFHDPSSTAHIGTNMLSLWIFGRMLEPILGSARFAALLLASIFTGSLAVILLEEGFTYTVGLSGGIFGLIGAVLVLQITRGQNVMGTVILLGLNALMPLLTPNISWEGHLGGFLGGILYAFLFIAPEERRRRTVSSSPPHIT